MWKIILLILSIVIISCKETTIDPPEDTNQQHVGITPGCVPGTVNHAITPRVISVACVTRDSKYAFISGSDYESVRFLYDLENRKLYNLHLLDTTIDGYTITYFNKISNCPYNSKLVAAIVYAEKDTIDASGNKTVLKEYRIAFYNVNEKQFVFLNNQPFLYTQTNSSYQFLFLQPFQWMNYSSLNNDYFYIGNNEVLHLQSNTKSKIQNVKGSIMALSNDGNFVISNERIDNSIIFYLNNVKINQIEDKDNYIQAEYIRPVFSPDNRFFVQHDNNLLNIRDSLYMKYPFADKTVIIDIQKSITEKKVVPNKIFYNYFDFCSAYQSYFATFSSNYNFYVTHTQRWQGFTYRHGNLYEVSTDGKIVRSFDLENTEVE